ncbi:MAG: hypothetical protein ACD_5C00206G0014 [uncultured bacterium]|nr:MAG: hypothetical protein ACD_5C00206G0014 [uncultured bacterium]
MPTSKLPAAAARKGRQAGEGKVKHTPKVITDEKMNAPLPIFVYVSLLMTSSLMFSYCARVQVLAYVSRKHRL